MVHIKTSEGWSLPFINAGLSVCVCMCACTRARLSPPVTQDVSASHVDTCTGGPRPPGKDEGEQRPKVRWLGRSRLWLWTKGRLPGQWKERSFIIVCLAAGTRWRRRRNKRDVWLWQQMWRPVCTLSNSTGTVWRLGLSREVPTKLFNQMNHEMFS